MEEVLICRLPRKIRSEDMWVFTAHPGAITLLDPWTVQVTGDLADRDEMVVNLRVCGGWTWAVRTICVDADVPLAGMRRWWTADHIRYCVERSPTDTHYLYAYRNTPWEVGPDGSLGYPFEHARWQYFDYSGREVEEFPNRAAFEAMKLPPEDAPQEESM